MRIYRPMMFVGLGGTGCKVGAELERRMREELCGPDGTRLLKQTQGSNYLPYQLPSCLQFVYADLSADELSKVRRDVVPGQEHDSAAQRTMRLMTNLVPSDVSNSSHVSQRLSLNLDEQTVSWLPPRDTDPNIGPLLHGAGQLPTVGRAVLFETLRRNFATAVQGIRDALTDINKSAGDLLMVSEGASSRVDQVDVFVVFSVAGGTGSGIFYDYLHLIGDVLADKKIQIYPLVLMPSSFDDGQGGGRPAELNAGSSLIDLFRLVDDQNAQAAPDFFDAGGGHGAMSVYYPPPRGQVTLTASTVRTAFLFGRPVGGVDRESLARSMVALMLSLIGAGPSAQNGGGQQGRNDQSFADGFINSAVERFAAAETGIGRRGVTTSAVAELTTPLQEITDLISSRLLASAVSQLIVPPSSAERNSDHMLRFLMASGLDRLRQAQPVALPEQGFPSGYDEVLKTLNERGRAIARSVADRPQQLREPIARLAREFNPAAGAAGVLRGGVSLFQLQRVLFGHKELAEPMDKGGFTAILEGYRYPPAAPPGFNPAAPPQPQGLPKKKLFQSLKWPDPAVQAVVREQDRWHGWRTRQVWNDAWGENVKVWDRIWRGFVEEFRLVLGPFLTHAKDDPQLFDARAKDLYKERVGVSYLLPPRDKGMGGFYQTVLGRLKEDFSATLAPYAREGEILNEIVDNEAWAAAYARGREDPEAALAFVRQLVKEAVAERLRPSDRKIPALIPSMENLLANAVGKADNENRVSDDDLRQFRQKLAALVPGGYAPAGHADLKVLFTYPAAEKDEELERFLRREVPLPPDLVGEPVFRAIRADSMVVVLMRSSMGITEVPEVRRVIKLWSEAQRNELPQDSLAWRRRLSQESDYLLMTPKDREHILHRLLCAAWDGKVKTNGRPESPNYVTVRLGSGDAATMKLDLTPLGALSSWASILQSFERFILTDDDPVRRMLALRLMSSQPKDVDNSNTPPPVKEFVTITELQAGEVKKVEAAKDNDLLKKDPQLRVVEDFWTTVLPAALARNIGSTAKTLGTLPELVSAAGKLGQ